MAELTEALLLIKVREHQTLNHAAAFLCLYSDAKVGLIYRLKVFCFMSRAFV